MNWQHCRIRHPADFKTVYQKGKRFHGQHWMLIANRNQLDHALIGITIPKKAIKLAVQRNQLKRLAREVFRQYYQQLPAIDIIFHCRRYGSKLENADIRKELVSLCEQLINYYKS